MRSIGPTRTGEIEFSADELLSTVTSLSESLSLVPGLCLAPRLQMLSNVFDLYRFEYLEIYTQTLVGTTEPGAYAVGFDANSSTTAVTYQQVASLNPGVHAAIWEARRFTVPADLINTQRWMPVGGNVANNPQICVAQPDVAPNPIAIWIRYKVRFSQPRLQPVDQVLSSMISIQATGFTVEAAGTVHGTSSSATVSATSTSIKITAVRDIVVATTHFSAITAAPSGASMRVVPAGGSTDVSKPAANLAVVVITPVGYPNTPTALGPTYA